MDGRTDGRMDGRMNGRTDRQTDEWVEGWRREGGMNGQIHARTDIYSSILKGGISLAYSQHMVMLQSIVFYCSVIVVLRCAFEKLLKFCNLSGITFMTNHLCLIFNPQDGFWPIFFHCLCILLACLAISRGVSSIEPVNRIIVPTLLVIVIISFFYSLYLPYAGMGIIHMFSPDWSKLPLPRI